MKLLSVKSNHDFKTAKIVAKNLYHVGLNCLVTLRNGMLKSCRLQKCSVRKSCVITPVAAIPSVKMFDPGRPVPAGDADIKWLNTVISTHYPRIVAAHI